MPYKLEVLVENRVLYLETSGSYSNSEVREVNMKTIPFLDKTEKDKSAVLIANFSKQTSAPANFLEVRNDSIELYQHPKYGLAVYYGLGDSATTSFFVNMLGTIFKLPTKYFRKPEDAIAHVISKYPELSLTLPQALERHGIFIKGSHK